MKKLNRPIIALLIFTGSSHYFAQTGNIGINTTEPKTTLDINGKKDSSGNLLTTDLTGLQAPRLTRAELTSKGNSLYGPDQKGALIYITDVSGGDTNQQRAKVADIGYYYFDGNIWQTMLSRTGQIIFTATLGTGYGEVVNASIAPGDFSTVPLPNVTKNLGGGIWDSANNTYTIPLTGTYIIKSSIRLTDNTVTVSNGNTASPSRNIYQAVHTSNTDIPDGVWQTNPDKTVYPASTGFNRFTMPYFRIGYFNAGDKLRLYIFSDGTAANISDASLNIVSVSSN